MFTLIANTKRSINDADVSAVNEVENRLERMLETLNGKLLLIAKKNL